MHQYAIISKWLTCVRLQWHGLHVFCNNLQGPTNTWRTKNTCKRLVNAHAYRIIITYLSLLIEPQGMVVFFLSPSQKEKSRCMEERPRFSLASNYLMIKYKRNEWKNVQGYTGWRFHSPKQHCHTMAHITYLDGTSFWKCHSTWFMVCLCSLLDMWIIQLSLQLISQISILALTVLVMTKSSRLIFSTHITVCYMSPFRITKIICPCHHFSHHFRPLGNCC